MREQLHASSVYVTLVAGCELSGVPYETLRAWRDDGSLRVHSVHPVGASSAVRPVYCLAEILELAAGRTPARSIEPSETPSPERS